MGDRCERLTFLDMPFYAGTAVSAVIQKMSVAEDEAILKEDRRSRTCSLVVGTPR